MEMKWHPRGGRRNICNCLLDWSNVPVDTLVRVRAYKSDETIACRDKEVAIFQNGNAVRMPLGQLKWLLEMCDEHYDNIKFAVEMYMRANRDEIGTIE